MLWILLALCRCWDVSLFCEHISLKENWEAMGEREWRCLFWKTTDICLQPSFLLNLMIKRMVCTQYYLYTFTWQPWKSAWGMGQKYFLPWNRKTFGEVMDSCTLNNDRHCTVNFTARGRQERRFSNGTAKAWANSVSLRDYVTENAGTSGLLWFCAMAVYCVYDGSALTWK